MGAAGHRLYLCTQRGATAAPLEFALLGLGLLGLGLLGFAPLGLVPLGLAPLGLALIGFALLGFALIGLASGARVRARPWSWGRGLVLGAAAALPLVTCYRPRG